MTKTTRRSLIAIGIAIILLLICFAVLPKTSASAEEASALTANVDFGGGSGTATDPYLIKNATQLKNIQNTISYDGQTQSDRISASFKLANDIYLSGIWTSIPAFLDGTFDGDGHKIYNLKLSVDIDSGRFCYGLFEKVGRGTIKNLFLSNVLVAYPSGKTASNSLFVGAVAGLNEGTISDCNVSGALDTTYLYNVNIGGIVGANEGSVINCLNAASVTGSGSVGGIAGLNWYNGKVTGCENSGSANYRWKEEDRYAGGIVGRNIDNASITNCSNLKQAQIVYVGPWTLLSPRPCMGQIAGWFKSGTYYGNTWSGTCDYHLLHGNQDMYCKEEQFGRTGD